MFEFHVFLTLIGVLVLVEKRILSSEGIELEKAITPLNGGFKGSYYDFWDQGKILHPKHWLQVDFEKLQILDFSSFLVFRVSKIVCCVQG